jgi:hypothetical protein
MSRLTDLLARYASHRQPIDLRLLEHIIRQEKLTGSLTIHYRGGEPKLLEAGKPIVVEVEPDRTHASDQNLTPARV